MVCFGVVIVVVVVVDIRVDDYVVKCRVDFFGGWRRWQI